MRLLDRRRIVFALLLCAFLEGTLALLPAHAIPFAGDYTFSSGDPNISGTFTSTGNLLSAWSFTSDLFSRVFLGDPEPYSVLSWSSSTDIHQPGNINDSNRFITNNASVPGDSFSGHYAQLIWNSDRSILNAIFRIDATCCDAVYFPPPTVSFALTPSGSVNIPDEATIVFLLVGLLIPLAHKWREQGKGMVEVA